MKSMIIKISYNLEKDIENYSGQFFCGDRYNYGRGKNCPKSMVAEIQNYDLSSSKNKEEATIFIRRTLKNFYKKNESYFLEQKKSLEKLWFTREKIFIKNLESYLRVKVGKEIYNGYFTTLMTAPFDVKNKSFYILLHGKSLATQVNNICHEVFHIIFLSNYYGKMVKAGLSEGAILDINESLTILLNLEFKELLITPENNNKPSTFDLQEEVIKSYKNKEPFDILLEKLIKMRLPIK